MKRWILLLLLSVRILLTWAAGNLFPPDSLEGKFSYYTPVLGPEMDEALVNQKIKLFYDGIGHYLVSKDEVWCIKDSVCINFVVNDVGRVDSVWLVRGDAFPTENTFKFIKAYDFKGPFVEYMTDRPEDYAYSYLIKLILYVNDEKNQLRTHLDFELIWDSVRKKRPWVVP